jgi:hypothetical protein
MLVPPDLRRMTEAAGFSNVFDYADQFLMASPGAVVVVQGRLLRIPTLVPRSTDAGGCVHWTDEGLCGIHAVAPFGCAFVDEHMDKGESNQRIQRSLVEVHSARITNSEYWQVWQWLWDRGKRGRDRWPEERIKLWQQAMFTTAHGSDRERAGALQILTLLTVGRLHGDVMP